MRPASRAAKRLSRRACGESGSRAWQPASPLRSRCSFASQSRICCGRGACAFIISSPGTHHWPMLRMARHHPRTHDLARAPPPWSLDAAQPAPNPHLDLSRDDVTNFRAMQHTQAEILDLFNIDLHHILAKPFMTREPDGCTCEHPKRPPGPF